MKQAMGPPGQYEMSGHAQNGPQTDNANFRNYPTDGSRLVHFFTVTKNLFSLSLKLHV